MIVALPLPVRFVDCLPLGRVVLADGRSVRTLGNSRVDTRLLYAPCYDFLHLAVLKQRACRRPSSCVEQVTLAAWTSAPTCRIDSWLSCALVTPFSIWRVLT